VLMGAPLEVLACAPAPASALASAGRAFDRVRDLDASLSAWRPDSEVSRLNREGRVLAGPDLRRALELSLRYARLSRGAFDPTVGSLAEAWGLRSGGRVPLAEELRRALARTGHRLLRLRGPGPKEAVLSGGARLDLGGIGKGFALDEAALAMRRAGALAGRLNFGGQILVFGSAPGSVDGSWEASASPPGGGLPMKIRLLPPTSSLSISGDAELPGHVLDPRSGRPVRREGLAAVVAPTGAQADALSTALYVLGPKEGLGRAASPEVRTWWIQPRP